MDTARTVRNSRILGLLLLCLCVTTSSAQSFDQGMGPVIPHDYLRIADVERQCRSVFSSAAELTADADRADVLTQELQFANGDWHQDAGDAPLMPFHGSHAGAPEAAPEFLQEATRLASFTVTHIDPVQRQRHPRLALNVSGVLTLTISRNCCCSWSDKEPHRHVSPEFKLHPGNTKLTILLEGVYTQTRSSSDDDGGGERVLCMVGNALLPMRGVNSTDPWDWAKNVGDSNFEPPVTADGNILLMVRYPKVHTLTNRAVRGEMMSTGTKSDNVYFDTVRLVSQFGQSTYQFRPEEEEFAVTGSECSTRPFFCEEDVAGNCAAGLYRGVSFCNILRASGDQVALAVVPNWKCNSTDEFCSRLGPFETNGRAVNTTGRASTDFTIVMQNIRCESTSELDGKWAARVSAVFRAVPPWEDQQTAARRTGLSGMTMSAEGVWRASTGRLCMVGCLGLGKAACQYRVSLYVLKSFSITHRSIVMGQIISMDGSQHFPLSFQRGVHPRMPWNEISHSEESLRAAYSYSMVEQAMELLRSSKRSRFFSNSVAKSLLSYPERGASTADDMASLSYLSDDLGLSLRSVPELPEWIRGPFFQLQLLSIGPLVGSYVPPYQGRPGMPVAQNGMDYGVEQQEILNVSAAFSATASGGCFDGSPMLSLEGVYNPEDGRMYLIGCRNVDAPWRVISKIRDLESGMDCSIEVKVEYPSTTMRWLFSPKAKVYMSSTRGADDPLHFNRTKLYAVTTFNRHDWSDAFIRQQVEGILCITMLSATITAALGQLRYMKSHPDVVPYVSLAMLGFQALGYGVALVTDAKMLPVWPTYDEYRTNDDHLRWGMECAVKALTLAALFLTLRLVRKVRRSRIRALARSSLEPGRVPSDRTVLLCSLGVHTGGLLFVLLVHWLSTYGSSAMPPPRGEYAGAQGAPHARMHTRGAVVERYAGLVTEWFLLPQVIGNAVWRVNCKPLRKRYYAGVTGVWLLSHVYRYLRPPAVNRNYPREVQDDVMDFYSKVSDMVVPLIAAVLALSVYVQHRWNYKIVGWAMGREENKLQHLY